MVIRRLNRIAKEEMTAEEITVEKKVLCREMDKTEKDYSKERTIELRVCGFNDAVLRSFDVKRLVEVLNEILRRRDQSYRIFRFNN